MSSPHEEDQMQIKGVLVVESLQRVESNDNAVEVYGSVHMDRVHNDLPGDEVVFIVAKTTSGECPVRVGQRLGIEITDEV